MLLNVSPQSNGVIGDDQRSVLLALGEWLDEFGEAIYTSRAYSTYGYGDADIGDSAFGDQSSTVDYSASDIRYTTSKEGDKIYAMTLGMPTTGTNLNFKYIEESVSAVSLMGSDVEVKWEQQGTDIVVRVPAASEMNEYATVFVLDI